MSGLLYVCFMEECVEDGKMRLYEKLTSDLKNIFKIFAFDC